MKHKYTIIFLAMCFVFIGFKLNQIKQANDILSRKHTVKITPIELEKLPAIQEPVPRHETMPVIDFEALAIELNAEPELIKFVVQESIAQDVPYQIILAIGENESRWIWQEPKLDTNNRYSVGYMQINQPHWQYLNSDYGLDVTDPKENIKAGITIFKNLLDKYPLEKALVAYQCGEGGAEGIQSTEFSRRIIARGEELVSS